MVLQPEEPKISLSGVHHFARAASEFESAEGVFLFPELRIISTVTREVEPDGEGDEDPTGDSPCARGGPFASGVREVGVLWVLRLGPERILPWGTPPGGAFAVPEGVEGDPVAGDTRCLAPGAAPPSQAFPVASAPRRVEHPLS